MDSSVSPKDEIWFLRVCHHISTGLYLSTNRHNITAQKTSVFISISVRIWRGYVLQDSVPCSLTCSMFQFVSPWFAINRFSPTVRLWNRFREDHLVFQVFTQNLPNRLLINSRLILFQFFWGAIWRHLATSSRNFATVSGSRALGDCPPRRTSSGTSQCSVNLFNRSKTCVPDRASLAWRYILPVFMFL